jgi:hypothetical protein
VIVRGRIPVQQERPDAEFGRGAWRAWSLKRLIDRLRPFHRSSRLDPEVVAYVGVYESIIHRMLPDAPLDRLERLHADLFDGRVAPSAAYFTTVTSAATVLLQHLHQAAELLLASSPPIEAQHAFRRLVALRETTEQSTNAVLEAARHGYFDLLQDALFALTREVAVVRRSVEAEHLRLLDGPVPGAVLVAAARELRGELPANVIPLVRHGELPYR